MARTSQETSVIFQRCQLTGHTPGSRLADFDPFCLFLLLDDHYDNDWRQRKNVIVSLALNFRVCMLLKSAINTFSITSIPLSLHTTCCFSFPNASASMSTFSLGSTEATFDPKETIIKPWPPELLTNSSKSEGRGVPSLTFSGPTIMWPVEYDLKIYLVNLYIFNVWPLAKWFILPFLVLKF